MARSWLIFVLFLCSCMPRPQDKCGFIQDKWGQRVVWKQFPIQLVSMDSHFDEPLTRAMSTWNKEAGFDLFEFHPDGNEIKYEDPWVRDEAVQAVTFIHWKSAHITHISMIVNPYLIVDRESLFVHELGHVLGLDHSPNQTSVMYPTLRSVQIRRKLSSEDKINFHCGYRRRE